MKIQFLGGVQTVTGSKTLVTYGKHRLLVDCGLFQGVKSLRLNNWKRFPADPREIDSILLTHAHLDHSGYIPLLVKQGFRGSIFCSSATRDLAEIILLDSAKLQEEDADFANEKGYSKHHPANPLYSQKDVKEALKRFDTTGVNRWEKLPGGAQFRLTPSGHILGSTFIELEIEKKLLVFSGDLGRERPLLYPQAERIEKADYLVLESTYGDRTHHPSDPLTELSKIVFDVHSKKGKLIIPSFAVGRAQDLLFLFSLLKSRSQLPGIPIYLDTPMGIRATEIFESHPNWHTLDRTQMKAMWDVVTVVQSQKQSIDVMRSEESSIVIAGSGMISGGRVLHHLAAHLPDPKNSVLLVGYQAAGTRGRLLKDGISELKIHGRYIPVRASVLEISGLSAHADQAETLNWLRGFKAAPRQTFINHGEPQSSDALRVKMKDELGWESVIPAQEQEFEI
ncbi:MAG: MBL fold metallo-hydrolase [Xanthomonadaceae bacterium]|nr:MBL fold metallo-hydrolase [Xanthomonadaceae bacterium]